MKNQMWKKGVCLGMAAMMTAGMLAGCGESSESKDTAMVQTGEDGVVESGRYTLDADTPAWKLDTKEDTTLTWYVNAEWWNTEWGNDVVTKQIQKDMNVNIDFVVGDDTKLNTFFAGGDMPDIITIFDASSSVAQKADTWAYALQDLADNYDPYFYSDMTVINHSAMMLTRILSNRCRNGESENYIRTLFWRIQIRRQEAQRHVHTVR